MSYSIIIRPEAELDLQEAFEWYEAQTSGLGSEFVRAIDACLSNIGRNPLAYPLIYQQTRRTLLRRFPYGILTSLGKILSSLLPAFMENVPQSHGRVAFNLGAFVLPDKISLTSCSSFA